MAYEILQQPRFVEPVYNDIIFTVDSSNKTECKFKYIADIYVYDNVTSTDVLVETIKLYPEPEFGYGVFNIARVLENYMSDTLQQNQGTPFMASTGSIQRYTVRFGEEYDSTCTSTATGTLDITSVAGNYCWNGVFDDNKWLEIKELYNQWTLDNETRHFLTNQPDEIKIKNNEHYYLSFIQPFTAETALRVRTYDIANNLLGDFLFYNPITVDTDVSTSLMTSVGVGPIDLNRQIPDEYITIPYGLGSYPTVITQDVASYKCWMVYKNLDYDWVEQLPDVNLLTLPMSQIDGDLDVCGTGWQYQVATPFNLQFKVIDGPCEESNQGINGPRVITATGNYLQPGIYYQVTVRFDGLTVNTDMHFTMQIGETNYGWNSSENTFDVSTVGVQELTVRLLSAGDGLLRLKAFTPTISDYFPYTFEISEIQIQPVGPEFYPEPLGTALASAISEPKSFRLHCGDSRFEPVRLRFQNPLGGHDHFTYELKSTEKLTSTRNSYTKIKNTTRENIGSKYNYESRGKQDYYSTTELSYNVNSNWITEEELTWLRELVQLSMNAYMVENIKSWQFAATKKEVNDSINYFSIYFPYGHEFEVGDEIILQYDSPSTCGEGNQYGIVLSVNTTVVKILFNENVLIYNSSGTAFKTTSKLLPINITTTDSDSKRKTVDKLFNQEVNFISSSFKGQTRN
jgi:hypothetical protein